MSGHIMEAVHCVLRRCISNAHTWQLNDSLERGSRHVAILSQPFLAGSTHEKAVIERLAPYGSLSEHALASRFLHPQARQLHLERYIGSASGNVLFTSHATCMMSSSQ